MKKLITFFLILTLALSFLSVSVKAYDSANPTEEVSVTEAQTQSFQEESDSMVKNILIIQGILIGALALIIIIPRLLSFIKKQKRKKKNAEIQARYDREKREMEEKEKEENKLT